MQNEIKQNRNKILISLDLDNYSSSFIKPLVMLASQLNADLCGLLIEETELQKIANLPFSREITFPAALTRDLNKDLIARHLKQYTETYRKTLEELSQLANISCSFRTSKGPRIESVLSESCEFELAILLPEKHSSLKARQSEHLEELINPAVVFYNTSLQSQKAAQIIRSLADNSVLHQLKIITQNDIPIESIRNQFSLDKVNVEYQHIQSYDVSSIISLSGTQKPGLLILPLNDTPNMQIHEIRNILETLDCPLLMVR